MCVIHQLALVEVAGTVENVFAPRKLPGFAELLLGELGVVVAHPVGIAPDVATENHPSQPRLDGTNETLSHHRFRDAAGILVVGAEEIEEVPGIAPLLSDIVFQCLETCFSVSDRHGPETWCLWV